MIKSIKITNFRGIKEFTLDENFAQVNLFVGRNNSGKSSVLEAIYLTSLIDSQQDPILGIDKVAYLIARRDLITLESLVNPLPPQTIKHLNANLLKYNYEGDIRIRFQAESKAAKNEIEDIEIISSDTRYSKNRSHEVIMPNIRNFNLFTLTSPIYFYHVISDTQKIEIYPQLEENKENPVYFIEPVFDIYYKKLVDIILYLKRKQRLDKKIIELLRKEYHRDLEEISIQYDSTKNSNEIYVSTSETVLPISVFGDGGKLAVLISSLLLYAKNNSTILWEEPETHQHPGGLETILRTAFEIVKEKDLQLFITTQSIDTIKIFDELANKNKIDYKIFFLKNDKGIIKAKYASKEDAENLLRAGIDIRLIDIW